MFLGRLYVAYKPLYNGGLCFIVWNRGSEFKSHDNPVDNINSVLFNHYWMAFYKIYGQITHNFGKNSTIIQEKAKGFSAYLVCENSLI